MCTTWPRPLPFTVVDNKAQLKTLRPLYSHRPTDPAFRTKFDPMDTPSTAVILPVRGMAPQFGVDNWLAPNCTVVGDVTTGKDCSIWFGAVVRGDVCSIRLGDGVNIQTERFSTAPSSRRTSTLATGRASATPSCMAAREEVPLIGMGAVVMDRARSASMPWPAGAVVLEGTVNGDGDAGPSPRPAVKPVGIISNGTWPMAARPRYAGC